MKYIVIDDCNADMYTHEFANKDEAIKFADSEFSSLTKNDIKRRSAFYVLESVNPDEDADDHYDGDVVKEYI